MSESFYTVKPGDSLSKIAKEVWGDMRRWSEIFEANRDQIKDPNIIQVGQKLRIPGASTEAPEPAGSQKSEGQAPAIEDTGNQERHGSKPKLVQQE